MVLNNWARADRHRKLHLVGTGITGGTLGIILPPGMTLEFCNFETRWHILEHGYNLATFKIGNYISGTKINMNPQFSLEITVDETPRVPLQQIAFAMLNSVSIVRERFERYFGVKR